MDEQHIRRMRVEPALDLVDRFLNDVFLASLTPVRIVHGKGTGTLRQAVWDMLANHPLVKSYRAAYPGEGDAGVTVVEMQDRRR